jgi:AraC family transcriptional regulator, transcriptional activator of pobA
MLKVLTMKAIPVFSLDAVKGLIVTKFTDDKVPGKPVHRDDHYIFIFQEEGESRLMVDFNGITLEGCAVLCLLPGQVHYGLSVNK